MLVKLTDHELEFVELALQEQQKLCESLGNDVDAHSYEKILKSIAAQKAAGSGNAPGGSTGETSRQ